VVSLSKLLVREKADTRQGQGRGFYLICESRSSPDMYEFECRSVDERRQCLETIRAATAHCPADGQWRHLAIDSQQFLNPGSLSPTNITDCFLY